MRARARSSSAQNGEATGVRERRSDTLARLQVGDKQQRHLFGDRAGAAAVDDLRF